MTALLIVFVEWRDRRWVAEDSARSLGGETVCQEGLLVPANMYVALSIDFI